jgi:NAD+ kinase
VIENAEVKIISFLCMGGYSGAVINKYFLIVGKPLTEPHGHNHYIFPTLLHRLMKRVAVLAKRPEDVISLKNQLVDFVYDEEAPDFVISLGGDGTFLVTERLYPGVPKLIVKKDSRVCKKCAEGDVHHLLAHILKDEFTVVEHLKICAGINGQELVAANDIVIRNKLPTHAIRFELFIDGRQYDETIIGDGLVIATAFGSTGYYYSITRRSFDDGMGIAFNNTTQKYGPLVVDEKATIVVRLVRGDAYCVADNDPAYAELFEGERVVISKAKGAARVIEIAGH